MLLIDSHCHLDRVDLSPFDHSFAQMMATFEQNQIQRLLCVSIDLDAYPAMVSQVEPYPQIAISVGVHPNEHTQSEPSVEQLVQLATHPRNVAIGETGLDYFRSEGDLTWQQDRFRTHITAAKRCRKPLIIHTRAAAQDTLAILQQEDAADVGGVMHCFTESWEVAEAALAMGFYISFSGILTFKTAEELRNVAKQVPLDRLLIETDSPYLAPVPYRGKPNHPGYLPHIAECLANLRGLSVEDLAQITSENFARLFGTA